MAVIPSNPFILVDGSSYLFRAYHALPPLMNAQGQPTGAIYGVANMLRKLMKDYKPEKMIVVFDSKEKNFRHALYEPYKANRMVMPDELQSQIAPLFSLIRAMGLPLVVVPGVEADDIIGTLAYRAKALGLFTLISTGDKDFAQLVDDRIFLINTMSQDIFDRARVIEKFEVPPEQIIDYLALIGDSVDNIPGVPKVGPKTAVKWLQTYGSLEAIKANAADIPGKVGENLRETLEKLPLYRDLVTIDVSLDFNFDLETMTPEPPHQEELKKLFTELEFKTWLRDLNLGDSGSLAAGKIESQLGSGTLADNVSNKIAPGPENNSETPLKYEIIFEKAQFENMLLQLKHSKICAITLETVGAGYMLAELVGLSFAIHPEFAFYIPLGHDFLTVTQLERAWVLKELQFLLESETIVKVGHNLKYITEILANYGVFLKGPTHDVMLESYVLDSNGRHDFDNLVERHLGFKCTSYEDIAGKGAKQISFNQLEVERAAIFSTLNAALTLRLHQYLWLQLEQIPSLKEVYEKIEMPLIPVLVEMERRGVWIDKQMLQNQSKELHQRLTLLEASAHELAGEPFNLNSPKQLQEILFQRLNLPVFEKTPTGQPSTSESVLQELSEKYPLPKLILEYRSLSKLKSTYTDRLPEQMHPETHRVHTSYHQAVTSTGRLSSSDPNLQNIPIRTEEGRKIRGAFVASAGYKIVTADYSQIELRIMAHMSNDVGMVRAFLEDDDIHRSTAAAVYGVLAQEVSSEQRRGAKIINFGLIYGMSAFGLARQLGLDRKEAEHQVQRYFACFPGVKNFIDTILQEAREKGFVETLWGRRLYLPELNSRNMIRRKAVERAAVNAPMQGTNADIIKLAMIELSHYARSTEDKVRMIMQVHDELVFEVSEDILEEACQKIKSVMENIASLSVKLGVGIGIGNTWDEAHKS